MASSRNREVATQSEYGIVEAQPDWIKGGQRGSENVRVEDLVIPRLEIVQALSPALAERDAKFIPGAKMGDITNSVTRENYGKEVFVCPVHFSIQWLVWRDKKKGGGFFGAYPDELSAAGRIAQETAEGNAGGLEAIDTPQHLCLIMTKGGAEEVIIPLPRTKAKVSRQWNTIIRLTEKDRFARVYKITTAEEKNDKGTFWNYVITPAGFPTKALYDRAERFYKEVASGEKTVVMHVDEEGDGSEGPSEM